MLELYLLPLQKWRTTISDILLMSFYLTQRNCSYQPTDICSVLGFAFYRFNWSRVGMHVSLCDFCECVCAVIKQRFREGHNSVVNLPDTFPGVGVATVHDVERTVKPCFFLIGPGNANAAGWLT